MSDLKKKFEDLENQLVELNKINELSERMDRVKVLMDATGLSMEKLMSEAAPKYLTCDTCPISTFCDQHPFNKVTELGCSDIWTLYLKYGYNI